MQRLGVMLNFFSAMERPLSKKVEMIANHRSTNHAKYGCKLTLSDRSGIQVNMIRVFILPPFMVTLRFGVSM
jgi:hypothetical protein